MVDELFTWGSCTYIMGVLNVTPDSFSGDGTMRSSEDWLGVSVDAALRMEDEGADIIDVGGESTRPASVYPGAETVSAETELARVLPVVEQLDSRLKIPISIDTRKSIVAEATLSAGASIVNDVSMLADRNMASTAARHGARLIISHTRDRATYHSVSSEVAADLKEAFTQAREAGNEQRKIIIDPGIGFGKTAQHSLKVLRSLVEIKSALDNLPMLVGVSRKSFIGAILDSDANDRLDGNAAANAFAIFQGADIIRVHEVRAMARVAKVADAIARGWRADLTNASEEATRAVNRAD